jgi:hypothetical protein
MIGTGIVVAATLLLVIVLWLYLGEGPSLFGKPKRCPKCDARMRLAGPTSTHRIYRCDNCGHEVLGFRECNGRF